MKRYITMMLLLILLVLASDLAMGQSDFPNKPITFVYPMASGSQTDITARLIGKVAEKYLGQPVIIVNKTGGGGTVGTAVIAAAKPDGYTIGGLMTSPMLVIPHLQKLSYHPVKDVEPIIQYCILNLGVSVRGDSPFKTFKEFIEYSRKNPGVVTYGTAGANSAQQIIMEDIARQEKLELVHVPFKGGGEAVMATMGGHVTLTAGGMNPSLLKAKKLRLLALFMEVRWSEYPDIPTLKELGYSVPTPYFVGVGAPKGVPEPIMKKLEDAFTKAFQDPEFSSGMKDNVNPAFYRNRKDFRDFIAKSFDQSAVSIQELIKRASAAPPTE